MKNQRILLLGSGGREHAIAWKLSQSSLLNQLFISPGNPGTLDYGLNVELDHTNYDEMVHFIHDNKIDILVVGPEAPLVHGIADELNKKCPNLNIIGPIKEGAKLEGSKDYAKIFMQENNIPTAAYQTFTQKNIDEAISYIQQMTPPIVLKADGLAAGKGVLICPSHEEAIDEIKAMLDGKFGEASRNVVIEEFLDGIEFSVFVLCDGEHYAILPEAKDYKRIGEQDTGLNTGGMGSVSPVPFYNDELKNQVINKIIEPTINGLRNRNIDYKGFIFFGLILVDEEVFVIEYNVRLGDPETQSILARLDNDLIELFISCDHKTLDSVKIKHSELSAVTTVVVSGGYPESYEKGFPIELPPTNENEFIFHAGTSLKNNHIVSNGGRVIAATVLADSLQNSIERSQKLADSIHFANSYYRKDIGRDLL